MILLRNLSVPGSRGGPQPAHHPNKQLKTKGFLLAWGKAV
jgi:hypothetical protein